MCQQNDSKYATRSLDVTNSIALCSLLQRMSTQKQSHFEDVGLLGLRILKRKCERSSLMEWGQLCSSTAQANPAKCKHTAVLRPHLKKTNLVVHNSPRELLVNDATGKTAILNSDCYI